MGPVGAKPYWVGRTGGAPVVSAVPVGRALRRAPTGATVKVNHLRSAYCPSPSSQHLSQWRSAGGGRGAGGGKTLPESLSLHSVEPPGLGAGARQLPPSNAVAAPGAPRSSGSGARAPLQPYPACCVEEAPPQVAHRGLPLQTCHPTPRKRAAPSRLLFVPPLGSALRRRLLPPDRGDSGRRLRLSPGAPRVPSIEPAPNEGPFCLVPRVRTRSRAGRRR